MILNSFSGFYGFSNPKHDGAQKVNDAATPASDYNSTYLKNLTIIKRRIPIRKGLLYRWPAVSVINTGGQSQIEKMIPL